MVAELPASPAFARFHGILTSPLTAPGIVRRASSPKGCDRGGRTGSHTDPDPVHEPGARRIVSRTVAAREHLALYLDGWMPMDDGWYGLPRRAIVELDATRVAAIERRLRRSVRARPWRAAVDTAFARTVAGCRDAPRREGLPWISPHVEGVWSDLRAAGLAHSLELFDGDVLAAGMVAVVVGRLAFCETMFHAVPHAGNAMLAFVFGRLHGAGVRVADVQQPSAHLVRLGAREVALDAFRVLARNLAGVEPSPGWGSSRVTGRSPARASVSARRAGLAARWRADPVGAVSEVLCQRPARAVLRRQRSCSRGASRGHVVASPSSLVSDRSSGARIAGVTAAPSSLAWSRAAARSMAA